MDSSQVNNILAILAVSSVIIGFFTGLVTSEVFYTTVGGIITHFYQSNKINNLKKVVKKQTIEMQSLKDV